MSLFRLIGLLALAGSALASVLQHEFRQSPPPGFVQTGAAPGEQSITLSVALAWSDISGLEGKLLSISTPGSQNFRQWLSADQVRAYVQPLSDTLAAFQQFADAHGLDASAASPSGEWFTVTTTVSHANELFNASFETFAHPALDQPLTRTLSFSLPSELVGVVSAVHPTTSFELPNARLTLPGAEKRQDDASCTDLVTPACLQQLYGIPTIPAAQSNNGLLVTAYLNQFAQSADVSAFLQTYRPDLEPNTTFTLQTLDGGVNTQNASSAGSEANLDVEWALGVASGVPVTFLSVGGGFWQGVLDTTVYLANMEDPPTVVTTSYGGNENGVSKSMAIQICNGFMALGARGITVVYSSGDGGVRGSQDSAPQCAVNQFVPVFPASCPYVTAVGSTVGVAPERAANFSSGGFSNIFARPAWQDAAVAAFLQTVPADFAGKFNSSGRGFPDVSTQGWDFATVVGGQDRKVGGTSASAPTFAAVVALANDALLAAGKPALGFLNPWLYANGSQAFTDVTEGKNPGFTCSDTAVAFEAAPGWDPLTGWGTPAFEKMLIAAGMQ